MLSYSLLDKAVLPCEVDVVDEEDEETIPILSPFTFADDESDELIRLTTCPKLVSKVLV